MWYWAGVGTTFIFTIGLLTTGPEVEESFASIIVALIAGFFWTATVPFFAGLLVGSVITTLRDMRDFINEDE